MIPLIYIINNMSASSWNVIPCKITELLLEKTLVCGQSFRWRKLLSGEWVGVFADRVWKLKQTDTQLFYQVIGEGQADRQTSGQTHRDELDRKSAVKTENRSLKRSRANSRDTGISLAVAGKKVKQEIKQEPVSLHEAVVEPVYNTELITSSSQGEDCKGNLNHFESKDKASSASHEFLLRNYLQLDVNLEKLYKTWSSADDNFKIISKHFSGIRILQQDPVECLFAFICSSNNNISRISSMVEKLAMHYGKELCEVDGQKYFAFPSIAALATDGVEQNLRDLGFGYRARYIQVTAQFISEQGGEGWLYDLRQREYKEAKSELLKLTGVGPKVADCVSLFCLDKSGAIPVDTHVWQIAARDYIPKLKQAKSLTDKLYEEIGDHFRSLWGPYAGWAHSVLFTADLKQFKDKPDKVTSPKKDRKRTQNGPEKKGASTKKRK